MRLFRRIPTTRAFWIEMAVAAAIVALVALGSFAARGCS